VNPALLATSATATPDVQAQHDDRGICIDRVGIRGLRYPIQVETLAGPQTSIAHWELTVELEANQRGTHMSRFVETLEQWNSGSMSGPRLLAMLAELRHRLRAPVASAACDLTLFVERSAPVTGLSAQHAIDCRFEATVADRGDGLTLIVRVPVTTLCPCSKEISEYGAHNQRGYVEIGAMVDPESAIAFEDLITVAEASGSAPIYPLLKRVDERHVTMQAYDEPTFVEDVVRRATLALAEDERITGFTVHAENQESIHDHAAVATVHWERG
jgi:GTP cyclohydrolase FolE2